MDSDRQGVLIRQLQARVPKTGTGSPAGVVVGSPGDMYVNLTGGAGATLYVKESGVSNTAGWAAK